MRIKERIRALRRSAEDIRITALRCDDYSRAVAELSSAKALDAEADQLERDMKSSRGDAEARRETQRR